jgi:pimeloyl-ACP methyl ester carboxylesterase
MAYSIHVTDEVIDDLRTRIRRTRWPEAGLGAPWEQGTDLGYLRELLGYWADGYDWRAAEHRLNQLPQERVEIDGVRIHFVHRPTGGIPLILTHGWPSTFLEYLLLIPLLDGFDLVIPSLPGYGYSDRPPRTGVNYRSVARLWHQLMRGLGYDRYAAGGTDFGSGVATMLALDEPDAVIGLHLTNLDIAPAISEPLTDAEKRYLAVNDDWWIREGGYKAIQSTRPQTLGYGLHDSPAALAAWVLEKWRSWSDCGGELESRFSRDFLLTMLTIYWTTGTIVSSTRDYYDNRWHPVTLGPGDVVRVPTAIAGFTHQFVPEGEPPREWAERLYNVVRWTPMPRGGHFAAAEEPELLARDITEFFGTREGFR